MTNTGYTISPDGLSQELINRFVIKEDVGILKTTYRDNKFIDEEYKKLLEDFALEDEYWYSVYALGDWTPLKVSGRIYKKFTDDNIIKYSYNNFLPLILCCDFNVSPMKWCLLQNDRGIDYVFDELVKNDVDTETMAKAILAKYPGVIWKVYGDYSGTFRSTRSRTTDYYIIKDILKIDYAQIYIKPNPVINNRVNAVNWRLCNAEGQRRLFVDPKCEHLIKDLRRVTWKEGKKEEDKSNGDLTHISSALGYYIDYQYSLKGRVTSKQW